MACKFCGGPTRLPTDEFCCEFCAEDHHGADLETDDDFIELTPIPRGWESIDGGIESDIDQAVDQDNGEEE